jgi:hypothetical protein
MESSVFEHTDIVLPDDAKFKISPSQIAKFFNLPSVWYKEEVLGEKEFTGNTSTYLGTIVHKAAELFLTNKPLDKIILDGYVDTIDNPDVDKSEIKKHYPAMVEALANEYLIGVDRDTALCERQVYTPIKDGIYVGGSIDLIETRNGMVVDFKTTNTKPNTTSIPVHYKIQLLAYWYMLRSNGYKNLDRIRLVYVVKPTKTLPVRVFKVTETVSPEDYTLINDTLKLMADTMLLHYEKPELDYIMFKSYKLK